MPVNTLNLAGLNVTDFKESETEYHVKATPITISRLCGRCGQSHTGNDESQNGNYHSTQIGTPIIQDAMKIQFPEIRWIFFEPDDKQT